jgi:PTH2 family peptidyl-tRNA hydrolase
MENLENLDNEIKQMIVMRKDLNMRKGKMVAQGSHASMIFLVDKVKYAFKTKKDIYELLNDTQIDWIFNEKFKKICVSVENIEELLEIERKAVEMNIHVDRVIDSGLTEFNNIPTMTCIAIGPDKSYKIDKITGQLNLL